MVRTVEPRAVQNSVAGFDILGLSAARLRNDDHAALKQIASRKFDARFFAARQRMAADEMFTLWQAGFQLGNDRPFGAAGIGEQGMVGRCSSGFEQMTGDLRNRSANHNHIGRCHAIGNLQRRRSDRAGIVRFFQVGLAAADADDFLRQPALAQRQAD